MSTVIDGSASVTINSGAILGITSGTAVASTSGTSITFSSIPSWAKRITVMFQGVSTSGSSNVIVQIGAGSVDTSGYLGSGTIYAGGSTGTAANYTTGFGHPFSGAADTRHGQIVLSSLGSNIWTAFGVLGLSSSAYTASIGGSKTLSGTLDRVVITTVNGTDTFDAGSINILYE